MRRITTLLEIMIEYVNVKRKMTGIVSEIGRRTEMLIENEIVTVRVTDTGSVGTVNEGTGKEIGVDVNVIGITTVTARERETKIASDVLIHASEKGRGKSGEVLIVSYAVCLSLMMCVGCKLCWVLSKPWK